MEDSEKRWWCMMEKGVGLHVLVLGMEEQACMYVHIKRSPFQQGPRAMPPAPTTPQALEHHLLYGALRAAHFPLPTPTRVD